MDVADLLKCSEPELAQWVREQDIDTLNRLFQSIRHEIRGAPLTVGQPSSVGTAHGVALARVAETLANHSGVQTLITQSWLMLAQSLNANEQYNEAVAFYERVIPRLEDSDPSLANRNRLGFVAALFHAGRYPEAMKVAAVAEQWFKNNDDEVGFARLCTNVANIYHRLDEHAQAYQYHLRAVETFEQIGDQVALAQSALNLGNALAFLNQFQESDEMYEKAEKLSLSLDMTELWAQASYNRAYLYYLRGRYSDALQGFSRLRSHFEQSGSERHAALCDLDEAEIYLQLNLSKDAATLARRAVDQFNKLGLHYELAKSQVFLGVAMIQLGRSDEALEVFQAAQKRFESEGNHYWVGVLDLYRAEVHISLKRLWEARSLASSARERFNRIGIPSKRILSLVVLGRISLELKDIAAADACVDEILEITRDTTAPLLLFPYYVLRGDLAERKQQWDEAEQHYESAAQDLEVHQSRMHHDDLRVTFFSGRNRAYEELVWLKLRSERTGSIADGYDWCERSKSRGLIELLEHHIPTVQPQTEDPLLGKINRLREELNMLYARSQPELRAIPSLSNFDTIANKENELARSLREISRTDPEYASLQQVNTATLKDVQEMLPEDTTVVEYFIARDEVLAFVISRSDASVERHLCPVSRVFDLHHRLGFQLEKFQLGQQFLDDHADQILLATQHHLRELHRNLFARLADHIHTSRITIVPHGTLHLLPFHAFYDGEKYLIDRFDVSYAPSASVLKYCLEKRNLNAGNPTLIGVADEQAPYVEDEIRQIARMFPSANVLLNEVATREAFVNASAQASFLHIATHAVFRHDNPMFSGFKLFDGWMTAFDLFSMSCQTNLVTLSGCKSGMSQIAGSDDLVGLMRGFLYAGARSLMVSLWNVDDKTTSLLMSKFYDFWRDGSTRSGALSAAMREIREIHPNPFYWAPFLLIGKL